MPLDPSDTVRITAHSSLRSDEKALIGQTVRFLRYAFPEGFAVVELRNPSTKKVQRFHLHPECLSKE